MDLIPARRRVATLVQTSHLDFLGAWVFGCENPRFRVLDFLGFPWILSSESRLINGLRGISGEKFFRKSWLARKAGTRD
jgi:hypothetical protein